MENHELLVRFSDYAKKTWQKDWSPSNMEYDEDRNEIVVWIGEESIYKAGFDADTFKCNWTKC